MYGMFFKQPQIFGFFNTILTKTNRFKSLFSSELGSKKAFLRGKRAHFTPFRVPFLRNNDNAGQIMTNLRKTQTVDLQLFLLEKSGQSGQGQNGQNDFESRSDAHYIIINKFILYSGAIWVTRKRF